MMNSQPNEIDFNVIALGYVQPEIESNLGFM